MRDHDDRPASHMAAASAWISARCFVFRVSKRRRLIEHQDGAILQKRPGDSNALPLAAGEKYPTFPDSSVVTFWQSANKIMGLRHSGRRYNRLQRRIRRAQTECYWLSCRQKGSCPETQTRVASSGCPSAYHADPRRQYGYGLCPGRRNAAASAPRCFFPAPLGPTTSATICPAGT